MERVGEGASRFVLIGAIQPRKAQQIPPRGGEMKLAPPFF